MREFRGGVESGPCCLQLRFECLFCYLACALSVSMPSLAQGLCGSFDGEPESVNTCGAHTTAAAIVGPGGGGRRRPYSCQLPCYKLSSRP